MITFDIVDIWDMIHFSFAAGEPITLDVKTDKHSWISEHSEQDEQCLNDYLNNVDFQTTKLGSGGIAVHIRTTAREKLKKKSIVSRLRRKKTIEDYFDTSFNGYETRVIETKKENGFVYDIFVNATDESIQEIIQDDIHSFRPSSSTSSLYLYPEKCGRNRDKVMNYGRVADLMESVAKLYNELGIREGNLVAFSKDWPPQKDTLPALPKELVEVGSYKNCKFYNEVSGKVPPVTKTKPLNSIN